jgi:hypothetical protein
MFQKILKILFLSCVLAGSVFAWNPTDLRSNMNPTNGVWAGNQVLSQATGQITGDENVLTTLFGYVRDFIFDLVWIAAIGVFLYFGFKMISAQWNPEELKKVLIWFLYAVIWLAIIPLSWAMVKLVSSLDF